MKRVSLPLIPYVSLEGGKMFYEHLAWFTVLWVSVLVARRLWRAAHQPASASVSSPKRKTPRPRPHTPNDCPVCGRPHPTPLWGNPRQAGAPAASRGVKGIPARPIRDIMPLLSNAPFQFVCG